MYVLEHLNTQVLQYLNVLCCWVSGLLDVRWWCLLCVGLLDVRWWCLLYVGLLDVRLTTYSAFYIPTHPLHDELSDSDAAIGLIFGFYGEVRTPEALFVPNMRDTRAFRAISDYGVRYLLK
jgi:hypothetical protein